MKRNGDIIACNHDKKVRLVSDQGWTSTLIETAPFFPCGVCLTATEEIVLCMKLGNNHHSNHLAVHSADGTKKLRHIKVNDVHGNQVLADPYRVVATAYGFVVVNHGMNVVKFDDHGRVDWTYDGSQIELKHDFYPRGLCTDKFFNILVTDYDNRCVHRINHDGCLLDIILSSEKHGLKAAWGIGLHHDSGEIWVGSGSDENILVASYSGS